MDGKVHGPISSPRNFAFEIHCQLPQIIVNMCNRFVSMHCQHVVNGQAHQFYYCLVEVP
jgi:hypothetical protein